MSCSIAITGSLCDIDLIFYELLTRYSIECFIIRHESKRDLGEFSELIDKKINIKYYETSNEFYHLIQNASAVVSFSGEFLFGMGRIKYLFSRIFRKFRVIHCMTGADFMELPLKKSLTSFMYRDFCRSSFLCYLHPVLRVNKNIAYLKLNNYFFARFPYLLPTKKVSLKEHYTGQEIRIFHPANLDFGIADSGGNRFSTKGNNKFIMAILLAIQNGLKVKCTLLDRGPDKEYVKKLIVDSGYSQSFEWLPFQDRSGLWELFQKSDLIVDQFELGCFGMIATEAMSQAKPVMTYIDKNYWPLIYDEEPPAINCHTEDEIYNAIMQWSDRSKLQDLGERAERWIRKYHDVYCADFSEIILRICMAAGLDWPRIDLAKTEQ